jgi:hypothetical protein
MPRSLQTATAVACCAFGWATAAHGAAAAHAQRCSAAPYGDTPAAYQAYMSTPRIPAGMLTLSIRHACEGKFESKPDVLLAFGSTPDEIAQESTTQLAVDFIKGYVRYNATRAAKWISVQDFDLHADEMAQRSDAVKISGAYVMVEQNRGYLFADQQAAITAQMCRQCGRTPYVALGTQDASRSFQALLLSCQGGGAGAKQPEPRRVQRLGGCAVTIIGFVTVCEQPSASGGTEDFPCVEVLDGQ